MNGDETVIVGVRSSFADALDDMLCKDTVSVALLLFRKLDIRAGGQNVSAAAFEIPQQKLSLLRRGATFKNSIDGATKTTIEDKDDPSRL